MLHSYRDHCRADVHIIPTLTAIWKVLWQGLYHPNQVPYPNLKWEKIRHFGPGQNVEKIFTWPLHEGRMWHNIVFNVGCPHTWICIWAKDKNGSIAATIVTLASILPRPSLYYLMRKVLPLGWKPRVPSTISIEKITGTSLWSRPKGREAIKVEIWKEMQ